MTRGGDKIAGYPGKRLSWRTPLRIALVSPLFESVPPRLYGGTERIVASLCRGLSERGADVTLFASGDSRVPGRLISVVDEALRLRKVPSLSPFAYSFQMLALVARHAREFDVVHNHHDYWMLPFSEMRSTPMVTTLHGRLDLPEVQGAFRAFPGGRFVSISDAQRKPLPDVRWLRTVHHGIDTNALRFQPKPGKYLAFLGRISSEKRPEWAIEIARRSGVPLKIAAKIESGADRSYFESCVKKQIDGRFIEYIGEVSDAEKSDFLGNALALVFPIDWPEPFGLVTIEALATGTPVLARPFGAVPEVLADGVTGFIRSDIAELASLVPGLAKISRGECRRWVEERFSIDRMIDDYLEVYQALLAEKTRAGVA